MGQNNYLNQAFGFKSIIIGFLVAGIIGIFLLLIIYNWFYILCLNDNKKYLLQQITTEEIKKSILLKMLNATELKYKYLQQEIKIIQDEEDQIQKANTSMITEDMQNELKLRLIEFELAKNRYNELAETGKVIYEKLFSRTDQESQLINLYEQLENNLNKIKNKQYF